MSSACSTSAYVEFETICGYAPDCGLSISYVLTYFSTENISKLNKVSEYYQEITLVNVKRTGGCYNELVVAFFSTQVVA